MLFPSSTRSMQIVCMRTRLKSWQTKSSARFGYGCSAGKPNSEHISSFTDMFILGIHRALKLNAVKHVS